ncbi:SDR family NAD(P)-dependent oxidoreductase [Bacillus cereus group sp. TH152-1LC]|uniref:SDR family NAD(P)-dependent oxidoreductase n=1 Tax=Bacillus cereus group sp. TH152-1LC TaxID=3018060 RepID=UPI0022E03AEE|nr:SDR family NAD(P)-dependent oxidoreductase [Bacillus cereus group sp. TH152-1LC]MDA1677508.1 SDR family NAD(P)-dependent oxidoreductase [Bacillus cereus group sp. TH152-1LC]
MKTINEKELVVDEVDNRILEKEIYLKLPVTDCAVLTYEASGLELIVIAFIVLDTKNPQKTPKEPIHCIQHFIKVSQIPYTENGEVNYELLEACINDNFIKTIQNEQKLNNHSNEEKFLRLFNEQEEVEIPYHIDDLNIESKQVQNDDTSNAHDPIQDTVEKKNDRPIAYQKGESYEYDRNAPNTLIEMLLNTAKNNGHKGITYIEENGKEVTQTYAELLEDAGKTLVGLRKYGLKPGDSVILQFNNHKHFITTFWGCILGGIIPTPIATPPTYTENSSGVNKLKNAWELLGKSPILTEPGLSNGIERLKQLWGEMDIPILDTTVYQNELPDTDYYEATEDDLVINLLSSGSTGMPKCIQHRHRSILARIKSTVKFNCFTEDDISMNWMPLDHVGGIVMFHVRDVYIGCQHINPKLDLFLANPLLWLDWVEKYKVSITWAPNFSFALLNEHEEEISSGAWDLSSLHYIMNAAEQVVTKTSIRFLKIMKKHGLPENAMVPAFGMSETSSAIVQNRDFTINSGFKSVDKTKLSNRIHTIDENHENSALITEVGVPIQNVEIRIVDGNDQVLHEDEIGHLQAKGPTIMNGYYKNEKENKKVYKKDGWFDTGDLAYINNGRLTITGRAKDVIIINGANFLNHEIESVVEEIEGVKVTFTAACGIPNLDKGSDDLVIFFVSEKGERLKETGETIKQIRKKVIRHFGIEATYVIPVTQSIFPKTNSGKIQRAQLAKLFQDGYFKEMVKEIDLYLENHNTLPQWFFKKDWIKKNNRIHNPSLLYGITLIFMDPYKLGEQLANKMDHNNSKYIKVYAGDEFKKISDNSYVINPNIVGDYESLLSACEEQDYNIKNVVHLLNYDTAESPRNIDDIEHFKKHNIVALLNMVQAFSEEMIVPNKLFVVTTEAQLIDSSDQYDYKKSMLTGFLKTLNEEWQNTNVVHIDFQFGNEHNVNSLYKEITSFHHDIEVGYRGEDRYSVSLRKVDLLTEKSNQSIKENGCYLVSGGLGGVGFFIAKELISKFNLKLLIIGRSQIENDPNKEKRLQHLESLGDVRYHFVDVTNEEELVEIVENTEHHWNQQLDGVIHLAGVGSVSEHFENPDEYSLGSTKQDFFLQELQPKVNGAWVLSEIVGKRKNCEIIFFSSVNGFFGGTSFGAYSTANSFLDGFAQFLRVKKNINAKSLAWSMWDNIGMSKDIYSLVKLTQQRGFKVLSTVQGLNSFFVSLNINEPLLLIGLDYQNKNIRSNVHTNKTLKLTPTVCYEDDKSIEAIEQSLTEEKMNYVKLNDMPRTNDGKIDRFRLVTDLDNLKSKTKDYFVPSTETEQKLFNIWKETLNVQTIQLSSNFFELGGHSILASKVIAKINKEFHLNIALNILFEKNCFHEMLAYINNQLN